ncbi:hypothetical protein AB0M95_03640 [Sphaerisporangium sp. NPDC051017]|uniref:hypothetical protein n=1 Tax=Sphaerisporangium sp. NPDC051017 TaxID=3154636 RepID=UPI003423C8F4
MKRRSRISASPATVADALSWLATRYKEVEPTFSHPEEEGRIGLGFRLEVAEVALAGGVDVQWGFWLHGGRFASAGVVCCSPNRHAPAHACPAR